MGSSGAGKTTLMDVIAGRTTGGQTRGDILLNGYPATDLAIRRATGYCEQMDIHSEASTFREALTFGAFLRQGAEVPDAQKYDSVNECLELLDLHPIADQIIRGSSTEQMKRLTIGVQLAAQPSVLFLDEPTSGLDARSAKLIMDGVRKVADTGRTMIHQPSAVVFSVFDSLLLLKRGGEMTTTQRPGCWRSSVLVTASYNLTRFLISIMLGLVFGIAYVGAEYSSYQGINSGLGMVFMTQSYMTFIVFSSVVPISIQERASFYRERSAQTYNAFWYFIGATIVEIPYCFVESLLFMVIYYPMVGFTGVGHFMAYWVNLTGLVILQAYFGQLLAYLCPNLEVASVFVILVNYVWITFTGFNPPYTFASLITIVFGDCPSSGDGSQLGCQQMTGAPPTLGNEITVSDYLDEIFSAKRSEIWSNFGFIMLWIACLRVVSLLALRFVNHQK
ncbi:ATP-binding Cassette (ABC) Superfamily [Phytophthora infestans T30-4]|uniref:ATP-binding Cassette (ABC) Superfamily n=1 Tax=Phytophthora infestans (strain T30-4) TaxID=403677 RepID=D0MUC6_PHYIT|nr:ATP-binding Cassette (ABC) Superfamily [Phytophthora infestans T30-4]EEY61573.1 ATP-binding Cassette (ABC) Superfamily [Phytophthora infestans T30-4]|eukprot:XP_002908490.1 ATP-binding Cassette (ABC) Superfamily [Phytophthora infestans T30-4]